MICEGFKYPALIEHFERISAIPRMSYHEEKIAAYLVEFAEARGLEVYTDSAKNVLINIPATEGREGDAPILLQGHTDMVCEKNIGCEHDFLNDGLDLYVENGVIGAKGTTLGADDGISVAVMLALLDGEIKSHPACQCLFTSAEEVGLDGAKAFDYSRIFARRMINMDGADEIYLIVGCAGGLRSDSAFEVEYVSPKNKDAVKISIGGLMGGHSGENINDGRANANKLAGELLGLLYDSVGIELISFNGGSKDNAIPREAILSLTVKDAELAERVVSKYAEKVSATLCDDDNGFFIRFEREALPEGAIVFADHITRNIIKFVNSVENGVLAMSKKIEGLVEFSRNLGIVRTENRKIIFYFSSRSAIDEQIELSARTIESAAQACGGVTTHHSRYPGWHYTGDSPLADRYIESAKRLCGMNVVKTALHAGLECGIVKQAIPDMEIISCGPDIKNLHSPMETLNIASFERFFTVIKYIIENE
ncbi:MAG: beta-Ala-His dipeptidase [Clostridia bacterium]|nr:beta-Ala-His dipeptidase [Clostridia bacterium]